MRECSVFDLGYWQQRAARQTFIDQALIGGQRLSAESGATFDTINPATRQVLALSLIHISEPTRPC